MILGLSFSSTFCGQRPAFSSTPGRKGSIRISTLGIRERMREMPEGDLMSTAMEALCRVRRSEVGGGGCEVWAPGTARSMRRIEAPQSASKRPANGPDDYLYQQVWLYGRMSRVLPGASPANSSTRRPVRGGDCDIAASFKTRDNGTVKGRCCLMSSNETSPMDLGCVEMDITDAGKHTCRIQQTLQK